MKISKVLELIGKQLNENNITWAVGASILLRQYELTEDVHDIDLVVALDDIEKADEILTALGTKKVWEKSDNYSTKHFYEYTIGDVDVDVMSGLTLNHDQGAYRYHFDKTSVAQFHMVMESSIPFMSLEDWYVIYQLIPGREEKVANIEGYFKKYGVTHKNLLNRALEGNLPPTVVDRIQNLLE